MSGKWGRESLLDQDSKKWLKDTVKGSVKFDEPMSRHTSFKVGGPADAFVVPQSLNELTTIVKWTWENDLEYLVIGDGTNLLVKDSGIRGIVLVLTRKFKDILMKDDRKEIKESDVKVTVMAGCRLQTLCRFAIEKGLKGMNFALGIPGSVGGAVAMNAGTSGGTMGKVLDMVKVVMPTGRKKEMKKSEINFSYRKLTWGKEVKRFSPKKPIIVESRFCLTKGDPAKIKKEADDIVKFRREKQPQDALSAGCFFKNPLSGKTAGELIEMVGLKGKRIGGAKISEIHANFIVNCGRASASDIFTLKESVQEKVSEMFNIDLEPEVKIVG